MMSDTFFALSLTFLQDSSISDSVRYAIFALAIILGFLILDAIINGAVFNWTIKLARKASNEWLDHMLQAFHQPLRAFILMLGIYISLRYLPLSPRVDNSMLLIFRSLLIIIISWGFYRFCAADSLISEEFKKKTNLNNLLIPFLSKVLRFIIVALAVVLVANEWGFNVNGFIAGLGLGGLAFALAAKDMLANIFAGIVILMEKPFTIGERISSGKAQGVVEDISFRSTKIRAADQSLVTVPNSLLANEAIVNLSRMDRRKVSFYLGLAPDTDAKKLAVIIEKISQILKTYPAIQPDSASVNFEAFNANSLDILITYYTISSASNELQKVKQEINIKLREIVASEGASLAVPTQTVS